MRVAVVTSTLLAFACATTPAPAVVEEDPGELCQPIPALAATRIPKPADNRICSDNADRKAAADSCNAGDPDACYRIGACMMLDAMGKSGAAREPYSTPMLKAFAKSCAAGMAEACTLRVAERLELGQTEKAACDDVLRAVHLGDMNAQMSCLRACR